MTLLDRPDFEFGNTRLRARKGDLLGTADYDFLLGQDIDGLLATLGRTAHAPDIDANGDRDGRRRLHETIRTHLGRSLEEMRAFYSGRARVLVDLLLARFDLQNLVALLRSHRDPEATADDTLRALVPMGWLDGPVARESLRPHELSAMVDLLARSTPHKGQRRALRSAFDAYERTEDLAAFERAVVADHATRTAGSLAAAGASAGALAGSVQRDSDDHNLVVALRLRDAWAFGAQDTPPPEDILRPGGSILPSSFAAAARAPEPSAVVDAFARAGGERWRPLLERWVGTGDLHGLQRSLERHAFADSAKLGAAGDPLGIDVPLSFTVAKQVEARNLRLLGEAATRGLAPETVRAELVWTGERP